MQSNVIAFTGPANDNRRARTETRQTGSRDNVISFANWVGRAMPRRTPTGVFFSTNVLMTSGNLA